MGGQDASADHTQHRLVVLAARLGRTGKTGISPSEACSRALALHAPAQPAVPISTATSADTAGGSGPQ